MRAPGQGMKKNPNPIRQIPRRWLIDRSGSVRHPVRSLPAKPVRIA